jgi:DNA invertase Pin-like site-specific DNA recombinase
LGRDYELIKTEYRELTAMGVSIVILDNPALSTSDKTDLERTLISSIIFELLAYLSEKERLKIKSRQAAGIKSALK